MTELSPNGLSVPGDGVAVLDGERFARPSVQVFNTGEDRRTSRITGCRAGRRALITAVVFPDEARSPKDIISYSDSEDH